MMQAYRTEGNYRCAARLTAAELRAAYERYRAAEKEIRRS